MSSEVQQYRPPASWERPAQHLAALLDDPWYRQLLELLDAFSHSTAEFWRGRGLVHAPVPLTTGSISSPMGMGSDSAPLSVPIGGLQTYLADSQQFALEVLCRLNDRGCWYVMESFRDEPNDSRHLGQFLHSEIEIPGRLDDVLGLAEEYLRHLTASLLATSSSIGGGEGAATRLETLVAPGPWPRLTFDAVAEELGDVADAVEADRRGFRVLTPSGERELARRHGEPIWVTHFDELAVPFYQASDPVPGGRRARNADLILGGMEVLGAGERHFSADALEEAMQRHGVDSEPYEWYLELRRLQPLQTSGFGLGVERFLLWALDHDDIRDMRLLLRSHGDVMRP